MSRSSRTGAARLAALVALLAQPAASGTFGELSGNAAGPMAPQVMPYAAGPYAAGPSGYCPPNCAPVPVPFAGGPEGALPAMPGPGPSPYVPPVAATPRAFLPLGSYADGPHDQLALWSFGQINSTTDPFDPWGLSTPYMYVPWSTPLAGWTNAATWNWWRERSGALPRNW